MQNLNDNNQQVIFGTCKIKDGLYIGDEHAAKDLEFILINKVAFVVNCSTDQINNFWESFGVQYFSFSWPEQQPNIILELIEAIYKFIEESVLNGQSCLIHSLHGQSRACSLAAIYLMKKFNWSLYKVLEYLNSRRSDLEIKTSFFELLTVVEQELLTKNQLSSTWEIFDEISNEELIILNTYQNAKSVSIDQMYTSPTYYQQIMSKNTVSKIKWISNTSEVVDQNNAKPQKSLKHLYKSIIKGSKKVFVKNSVPMVKKLGHSVEFLVRDQHESQQQQENQKQIMNVTFSLKQNIQNIQNGKMNNSQNTIDQSNFEQKHLVKEKENLPDGKQFAILNKQGKQGNEENQTNKAQIEQIRKERENQADGKSFEILNKLAKQGNEEPNQIYKSQIEQIRLMLTNSQTKFDNFIEPNNEEQKPTIEQNQQVRNESFQKAKSAQINVQVIGKRGACNKRSISNPKALKIQSNPGVQTQLVSKKRQKEQQMSNKQMNQVAQPMVIIKPRMPDFSFHQKNG